MEYYKLGKFLHKGALYCAVLKTHYGLPQAGALSQERLFLHLAKHEYRQLEHSTSLLRNQSGSIRLALVVDDFAVIWSKRSDINHFIQTLRKLYTVKVDWTGSKYLCDGHLDRSQSKERHIINAGIRGKTVTQSSPQRRQGRVDTIHLFCPKL